MICYEVLADERCTVSWEVIYKKLGVSKNSLFSCHVPVRWWHAAVTHCHATTERLKRDV